MKATTIKLDGMLLSELSLFKPTKKSLSAFIREILTMDIKRRKMQKAADKYQQFILSNKEEENWLNEWESSKLETAPKKRAI